MTRPNYTDAELRRFMALARGGRDARHGVTAAMRRHPAGSALDTGAHRLNGPTPIPRDLPPLTNADGTPADPLPAYHPEDHR